MSIGANDTMGKRNADCGGCGAEIERAATTSVCEGVTGGEGRKSPLRREALKLVCFDYIWW